MENAKIIIICLSVSFSALVGFIMYMSWQFGRKARASDREIKLFEQANSTSQRLINLLKSRSLVLILVLISFAASAQCKLEKDERDEFTGKVKKQTAAIDIARYKFYNLKTMAVRIDSNYYLMTYFTNDDVKLGCVTGDSFIILKLDNDEVIKMNHVQKIDCGGVKMLVTNITDHLEKIKSSNVMKVRYALESYVDLDIKKPHVFADLITCVQ